MKKDKQKNKKGQEEMSTTKTWVLLVLIIIASIICGYALGTRKMEREAVKNGFGEFKHITVRSVPIMKYFSWYELDMLLEAYTTEAKE